MVGTYLLYSETPPGHKDYSEKKYTIKDVKNKLKLDLIQNIDYSQVNDSDIKITKLITMENGSLIDKSIPHAVLKKITQRIESPSQDLVVCKINDEVGHGVFAKCIIPKGTIIGLYAGVVKRKDDSNYTYEYGTGLPDNEHGIDASQKGNITRFIQHMPYLTKLTDKDYDFATFCKAIKETCQETPSAKDTEIITKEAIFTSDLFGKNIGANLALANIVAKHAIINNMPVIFYETCREINKSEQLGVSYCLNYWLAKKVSPRYFDKKANVIGYDKYITNLKKINSLKLNEYNKALFNSILDNDILYLSELLEYKPSININATIDETKKTGLHYTSIKRSTQAYNILRLRGAATDKKDWLGKTSLDYEKMLAPVNHHYFLSEKDLLQKINLIVDKAHEASEAGEYDKAIKLYTCLASSPNIYDDTRAIYYENLGEKYGFKEDYETARKYLTEAINLGKDECSYKLRIKFNKRHLKLKINSGQKTFLEQQIKEDNEYIEQMQPQKNQFS